LVVAVRKPAPYLVSRLTAVRAAMQQRHLDGLLLSHPPDIAYLTDFTGDDSIALVTPRDLWLITDFRYKEQAQVEAGWLRLVVRTGQMDRALARTIARAAVRRLGFDAQHTTVADLQSLKKALRLQKQSVKAVPLDAMVANLRKVKDQHEVGIIRDAVEAAQEAFLAVRGRIRPGMTENHLAGLLTLEMRARGASGSSFPVIVAAGPSSSLPHYRSGEAPVRVNQPLLIDWGALLGGYCSDLTRTLFVGRVSRRMQDIYKVVLEAQMAAIAAIGPRLTTHQADKVARDIIRKAGYGKYFGHGLGHGIGREIHELPALRKTGADEPLRPGMVVTVEPGIYLPGEGGVRIEDDVLITPSGCEVLSSLDKSLAGCRID